MHMYSRIVCVIEPRTHKNFELFFVIISTIPNFEFESASKIHKTAEIVRIK